MGDEEKTPDELEDEPVEPEEEPDQGDEDEGGETWRAEAAQIRRRIDEMGKKIAEALKAPARIEKDPIPGLQQQINQLSERLQTVAPKDPPQQQAAPASDPETPAPAAEQTRRRFPRIW